MDWHRFSVETLQIAITQTLYISLDMKRCSNWSISGMGETTELKYWESCVHDGGLLIRPSIKLVRLSL